MSAGFSALTRTQTLWSARSAQRWKETFWPILPVKGYMFGTYLNMLSHPRYLTFVWEQPIAIISLWELFCLSKWRMLFVEMNSRFNQPYFIYLVGRKLFLCVNKSDSDSRPDTEQVSWGTITLPCFVHFHTRRERCMLHYKWFIFTDSECSHEVWIWQWLHRGTQWCPWQWYVFIFSQQ